MSSQPMLAVAARLEGCGGGFSGVFSPASVISSLAGFAATQSVGGTLGWGPGSSSPAIVREAFITPIILLEIFSVRPIATVYFGKRFGPSF